MRVTLKCGETVFVLGANGAGKSSLVTRLCAQFGADSKRISAHRQTWFRSDAPEITPRSRENLAQHIQLEDQQPVSRHVEEYAGERNDIALFDLLDAENTLARAIAENYRIGDDTATKRVAEQTPPLEIINNIMRACGMPVAFRVGDGQKIVARKNGGEPYGIAALSDGERNAFLIAASVLTAKPGTLLVIDEPERHLHRSIISPFLTLLFQQRSDCAFLVCTHEVMLPVDNPAAATLLLRDCRYRGGGADAWDADLLAPDAPIGETMKADILGGRRKMIFVEGTAQGLDAPIYSLLFPNVSVIAKSTCKEVEAAVRSLRDTKDMHRISAWGIVGRDGREQPDVDRLRKAGVFALRHYSVEALYHHPEIVRRIAAEMAAVTGKDKDTLVTKAIAGAIKGTADERNHLVIEAVMRSARKTVFDNLPKISDIEAGRPIEIPIDIRDLLRNEKDRFDRFVKECDFESLLERYPLRKSRALHALASALGLSRKAYEDAVRNLLRDDPDCLAFLRELFSDLHFELDRNA